MQGLRDRDKTKDQLIAELERLRAEWAARGGVTAPSATAGPAPHANGRSVKDDDATPASAELIASERRAHEQLALLSEATARLATSLDFEVTLERLVDLLVPLL